MPKEQLRKRNQARTYSRIRVLLRRKLGPLLAWISKCMSEICKGSRGIEATTVMAPPCRLEGKGRRLQNDGSSLVQEDRCVS